MKERAEQEQLRISPETMAMSYVQIEDLPDEILQMIFEYLSFPQKLIVRLVSQKWNEQVIPSLVKTAIYKYNDDQFSFCRESRQVFLDSSTPWTSLRCQYVRVKPMVLPTHMRKKITTLQLNLPKIDEKTVNLIEIFPMLKKLSICITQDDHFDEEDEDEDDSSRESLPIFEFDDSNFPNKLSSLTFTFLYNDYKLVEMFLDSLSEVEPLNLMEFELIEARKSRRDPFEEGQTPIPSSFPFQHIVTIISRSALRLKILRLEFYSDFIKHRYAPELLDKLKDIKELKLSEVWISTDFEIPVTETNFLIHQQFLQSQKKSLTGFTLPIIGNAELCQKLLKNIGVDRKTIKELKSLREEHMQNLPDNFLQKFIGLKSMTVILKRRFEIFDGPLPSVRKLEVYLELDPDDFEDDVESLLFKHLSATMVNVSELIVSESPNSSEMNDMDLQCIIKEFGKLRVLKINKKTSITDEGVTGASFMGLKDLIETRELYNMNRTGDEGLPSDIRLTGVPISSLKNLEELHLLDSKISDAGIFFGFRFGPSSSLRRLSLESKDYNITSWGLHWVGTFNPQLETFHGVFREDLISSTEEQNLKSKFALVGFNKKFHFSLLDSFEFSDSDSDW